MPPFLIHRSSLYNSFGNSSFLHQLLKSIYVWVRLKNVDVRDMMAIYQLLCCIPRRFNGYGVIRTVPFIFALQDLAYDCIHASTGVADRTHHNIVSAGDDFVQKKSVGADDSCSIQEFTTATNTPVIGDSTIQDTMPGGVITDDLTIPVSGATPSCIAPSSPSLDGPSIDNPIDYRSIKYQQSLATVTLEWIRTMAEITGMEQVMNYAQSIKEKRQHLHQEPKLDLTTKPTADAPCLDDAQFGINKVIDWMDRQKVVKAILDDDKLHDQQISDVNLEERLYVQWASESYENQEKGFRIEVDSDTDMKPKLTAAINNGSLQKRHSQGEKPIVNVENLKGALAAQLLGNEQQQQIIHPPSTDVKIELNQLLSGLYSTMSTKEQSISLVNPPY
ncbi:uncharacterized protein BX664DRAFT_331922 [Halteromyces radiatus]|uniref:uncharacterized protein n=1 Tax=Halteromyces radiatus TaxID=101107 RepID=UPI00221FA191|nr:uncharacterized protein BX664DRAFT_331922 [Halteromyces radiatus]KAI8088995.1 hypothetical protein BX664DRAFT_331922 [Halteromyces radiatus]